MKKTSLARTCLGLLTAASLLLTSPAAAMPTDASQVSGFLLPCTDQAGAAESPTCPWAVDELAQFTGDDPQDRWDVCEAVHGLEETDWNTLPNRSIALLNKYLTTAGLYRADCRLLPQAAPTGTGTDFGSYRPASVPARL